MNDEYISLPLEDGSQFAVTIEVGMHLEKMFPNVNVAQEFCAMRVWLECNPERRKTKRGINRFIGSWLIKAAHQQYTPSPVAMAAAVGRR